MRGNTRKRAGAFSDSPVYVKPSIRSTQSIRPHRSNQRCVPVVGRRRSVSVSKSPAASSAIQKLGSRQAQFAKLTTKRDIRGSRDDGSSIVMPEAELLLRLTLEQTDPRLVNRGQIGDLKHQTAVGQERSFQMQRERGWGGLDLRRPSIHLQLEGYPTLIDVQGIADRASAVSHEDRIGLGGLDPAGDCKWSI